MEFHNQDTQNVHGQAAVSKTRASFVLLNHEVIGTRERADGQDVDNMRAVS